ncbi:MAG: portal protein [bacterium]
MAKRKEYNDLDEDKKEHVKKVLDQVERLVSESSERIKRIELNERWFLGDEDVQWAKDRPAWKPRVMVNLIESNCRTKVALLTDSKPKIYLYGIPEVSMIDAVEKYFEYLRSGNVGPPPPEMEKAEAFRVLTQNVNIAFDHIWRFNDMHSVLENIVLYGSIGGLLVARVYWDQYINKRGEIRIEAVNPKYVFFDRYLPKINVEDGSCDIFFVRIPKPISWFDYYFPGHKVKPVKDIEGNEGITPKAWYTEVYTVDNSYEEEEGNPKGKIWKYPKGRLTIFGGNTYITDGPIDFFPYAVHPYEYVPDDYYGRGDVERQIPINEDFNSKLAQVSLNIALSANRQYVINPAKIGMKVDQLLEHVGEPGYVFQTTKLAEDVRNAFFALDTPHFNPELFNYLFYLPQLLEIVSGIYKTIQGLPEKRERQTRYEISKQYESATTRIRNTAHHVEYFLINLAQVILKAIKIYYRVPRVISSIDEQKGTFNTTLFSYPEEAQDMDFIVTVQPETMLPVDIQSQVERDLQLFQMKAIDPITLLESLNHPKVRLIEERLRQFAAQNMPQGQPPQGNTGIPLP